MWRLPGRREALPAGSRLALCGLLGACYALRVGLAWLLPNIHQADEVFQVAEQANRSLHGYGIVPWEFQTASRAAILPTLVKPIYLLNASAWTHEMLAAALFAGLSLIPVWVAFHWAARLHGLRGGVLAAAMMGTWFELLYFAPKATADAIGGYFFLAALFFARPEAGSRALFASGACLTLALGIRLQLAPAAALALILMTLSAGRGRIVHLLGGVATGLALVGIAEWAWWGAPFRGHLGYLTMEFAHGASGFFAREPITFFAKNSVLIYGAGLPVMGALIYLGAKKAPILLVSLVALLLPFHFVGHKEYRFAVVGVPVMVLLMGLGAADLMARFASSSKPRTWVLAAAGWLIAMTAMSLSDSFRPFWTQDRNHIYAFREIGEQPDACGVALVNIRWWHTPGYSGLGRNIPIYEIRAAGQEPKLQAAANFILAGTKAPEPPAPYVRWREYTRPVQYLYRRAGACTPAPADAIVLAPLIPGVGG